jgi:glutamyl-tRNA reductase
LRTAKRVRTETAIGSGQVSVPSVAVDVARQIFGELSGRTALLIGSGEMGFGVARLLGSAGSAVLVLGRTPEKVRALAKDVGGQPRNFEDLAASLTEADVVVTSTSSPGYVVDAALVSRVRKARRGRNLFLIDLAVPRDVDPRVQEIDGTFLYNIDDFSRTVAESLAGRQREREAAERIIDNAAIGYERWAEGEQVTPVIKALRKRFTSLLNAELEKSLRGKLKNVDAEQRAALQKMVDAAIKKMLHEPSSMLRSLASGREKDVEGFVDSAVEVLSRLFSLELDDAPDSRAPASRAPDDPTVDSDDHSGQKAAEALREGAAPSDGR